MSEVKELTRKDFVSDQTVRWCPGCGDYAILAQMQKVLPELGIPRENFVFISGIGCSSRFPYYMNTYGIHSIHGRAPTLATGLKIANPNLSVWVITGDGDGLSIGGNHLLHVIRRNVDLNIILFNNRIYGLTKGQYSPTSLRGTKTKSSPMGTVEHSFNPISVAIGAEATFVARTVDSNVKHMAEIFRRAAEHHGTSFVEVYQNCVIFNDGTWAYATDRDTKDDNILELEDGKPMIFGKNRDKGIALRGCLEPEVVSLNEVNEDDLLWHNERAPSSLAYMLSRMRNPDYPEPIGVFRATKEPVYEEGVLRQIDKAIKSKGKGDLRKLYHSADTWQVFPDADLDNGHKVGEEKPGPNEFDEKDTRVFYEEETMPKPPPSLETDTVAALNPPKPLIAHVDISLAEAVDKLKKLNVGFMALVDNKGKLVGAFTEGDVFTKIACKVEMMQEEKVRDYMTTPVTTLKCDAPIAHALHLMSLHHLRHIPIVDDEGKPDRVISFRSVVRYLGKNFSSDNDK
ncbi:MAG: CBS domain-containing protein [Anaerolineae bacterium]|nr:CBS domain-containing protein [Anaerolineae bacterium]